MRAPRIVGVAAVAGTLLAPAADAATNSIYTVAGTGTQGSAGNGGPATAAQLRFPAGVAVTPDGGFLIGDHGNHWVRKVAPNGTISVVAGTGVAGNTGDNGPATSAQLDTPTGVSACLMVAS